MELRVLGPLELRAGDAVLPIRRGRPRKLLLALLVHLGERVSTDALIDALWGSEPPRNAVNSLQILVSYLRKSLASTDGAVVIDTLDGGYRLRAEPGIIDARRLETAVNAAPSIADPAARLARLDDALSAWRGTPLAEAVYDSFAQGEIRRLEDVRLAAVELRADALMELGRHVEAAVDLQRLVLEHPLRERLHGQLMTALYRDGRQAEALAVYERARAMLVEELGLDPGPELQALSRAILEQSPQLRPLPPRAQPAPEAADPAGEAEADTTSGPPAYPQPLTAIVGREYEIGRLRELVTTRRLVTLTGPGGAGKTRLAVAVVEDTGTRPPLWVDLSSATDRSGVVAALVRATGITTHPGDDDGALLGQLEDREGLIVLDTCERVLRPLRPIVDGLLRQCPGLSVVSTSREPLGVAGELAWPVAPLSLPDPAATSADEVASAAAVQLFVQRAGDRRPGFALTDDNAADIARVVWLLDGLPLAVELAAGHAGVLDLKTMTRVLSDRLRLLVDDSRPDRQHALRSTIDWSYELLTPDEAVLIERLSVFAGPFTLEAAMAVAGHGLDGDALQVLLSLARQSLLAVSGDDRFRLLDTIRAFAGERLALRPDDHQTTAHNHARWCTELADEADRHLRGADVGGWLATLRDAMPELSQALTWCFDGGDEQRGAQLAAALAWCWSITGDYAAAAHWLGRAMAAVEPGTVLEAHLLTGAGMHASSMGQLDQAVELCGAASRLYEAHGRTRSLARSMIYLGVAQWGRGDDDAAAESHTRGAALFAELRDDWGRAICLALRARTAFDRGEPDTLEQLEVATAIARRSGDHHAEGICLDLRARYEAAAGNLVAAEALAAESLGLNESVGYREGTVAAWNALGFVRAKQGRHDEACQLHRQALAEAETLAHAGAQAEGLELLAATTAAAGSPVEAARLLGAAEALRQRHHLRRTTLLRDLVEETRATVEAELGHGGAETAVQLGALRNVGDIIADWSVDPAVADQRHTGTMR